MRQLLFRSLRRRRLQGGLLLVVLALGGLSFLNPQPEPIPPTLTVALTGKYPPFSFYSADGELVGFDVDVAKLVAERLGCQLQIVTTEWDGILAGLLLGKYDAIIGSMAITPERSQQVDFSAPYYVSGAQLFVREEDREHYRTIADLEGRRLGVGLGETYEHYLRSHHPEIEVVSYRSTVDIFQDMENRRLHGFVTDRLVGLYQIRQDARDFVPAGPLLYEERMGIPVRKEAAALREAIDGVLRDLREEGRLAQLRRRWFGAAAGEPAAGAPATGEPEDTQAMTFETEVRLLGRGFAITLGVAGLALGLGFAIALPWAIGLHHGGRPLVVALRFFNDFVRGTPLLIQLFFVYFGAPQVGLTLSPIASAVVTLTVSCAAYMSEALRSGLMAVAPGQLLAGRALGLTPVQTFRLVVWPQAFRVSIPALMNIVVAFIKDTALISVISVAEVVREAQSLISVTFNPIKYYLIVAGMFFAITFPLMKLAGRIERRIKLRGYVHD